MWEFISNLFKSKPEPETKPIFVPQLNVGPTAKFSFSDKSQQQLLTADIRLQRLFNEIIKHYDCTIIQGHRGQAEQDEYFRTGKSKVQWPNSKHNSTPSKAVDAGPYPIDWNDTEAFYYFGGYVKATAAQLGINIRWGGDWDGDTDFHDQTFMDLVHFEVME